MSSAKGVSAAGTGFSLDTFAAWLRQQGYSATTIADYSRSVARWQRSGLDAGTWLAREQARSGSPPTATVLRYRSALVVWLRHVGDTVGAAGLHLPRVLRRSRPRPAHVVTPREEAVLDAALATAAQEPHVTVARLLRATGLRISEALGLRLDDVRADGGVVVLHVHGKGGRPRQVPLTPTAAADLARYLREQHGATAGRRSTPWLFPSPQDAKRPITAEAIRQFFRGPLSQACGARIHPHALRHRLETLLLEAGVHAKVAEDLQGHTAQTARIYQHPGTATLQAALEAAELRRRR